MLVLAILLGYPILFIIIIADLSLIVNTFIICNIINILKMFIHRGHIIKIVRQVPRCPLSVQAYESLRA
jgi:hypothetical protein